MVGEFIDEFVKSLANRRRRTVVRSLEEMSPPVRIEELAQAVREYESDYHLAVTNLETALYHTHLPHLAKMNILKVDHDAGLVRKGDIFPVARQAMETGKITIQCEDCGREQSDLILDQTCKRCGSPSVSLVIDGDKKTAPNCE